MEWSRLEFRSEREEGRERGLKLRALGENELFFPFWKDVGGGLCVAITTVEAVIRTNTLTKLDLYSRHESASAGMAVLWGEIVMEEWTNGCRGEGGWPNDDDDRRENKMPQIVVKTTASFLGGKCMHSRPSSSRGVRDRGYCLITNYVRIFSQCVSITDSRRRRRNYPPRLCCPGERENCPLSCYTHIAMPSY